MNAIQLLKEDHERIFQLFDAEESSEDLPSRRELLQRIRVELTIHSRMETEIFYPLFKNEDPDMTELIEQFYDDHQEVEDLVAELDGIEDEDEFDELFGELIEAVDTHVAEEEDDLFPAVEQSCSAEQLGEIGAKMLELKERLTRELGGGGNLAA